MMVRRTFLKLAAALGLSQSAEAQTQTLRLNEMPWAATTPVRGNLAVGNLRENLLRRLKTEKGVHVETLAAGIGAIAGLSAQTAGLMRAADLIEGQAGILGVFRL